MSNIPETATARKMAEFLKRLPFCQFFFAEFCIYSPKYDLFDALSIPVQLGVLLQRVVI